MKKIILFIAILFSCSYTFASTDLTMWIWTAVLESFQKIIEILYLLFWPLLVIAWKLLDNTFVYWSAFRIDVILWKLWQVVRVFANYFIWFVFIISIFIYFFKQDSNLSWKKIFPKIVIAGIVVNLSWFIIWSLIDLSSLLIYAFWDLASQFRDNVAKVWVDKTATLHYLPITYTWWNLYATYKWKNYVPCVFPIWKDWKVEETPVNLPCFVMNGWKYELHDSNNNKTITPWKKISIPTSSVLFTFFRYMYNEFFVNNTQIKSALAVIYISKLFLFFVLIVPLVILVIILTIRILVLWVVIPFSPLIFASYILWMIPSDYKSKVTDILAIIFQPAYVMLALWIWFVFIESVYQMQPKKVTDFNNSKLSKTFKIKVNDDKNQVNVRDLITVEWSNKTNWSIEDGTSWKNVIEYFIWLIVNLLSWFVMWTLVFTAFKSNKFTQKIAESIDTYAKKSAETFPIFPANQSIASLKQVWERTSSGLPKELERKQYADLIKAIKKNKWEDKK